MKPLPQRLPRDRERRRQRSRLQWVAAILAATAVLGACAGDGEEPDTGTDVAAACDQAPETGGPHTEVSGPYGTVSIEDGYEAVDGEAVWGLAKGEDDPVFLFTRRTEDPETILEELTETAEARFVAVCSPGAQAWLSSTVLAESTITVLAVISEEDRGEDSSDAGTIVIAGTQPDGTATNVASKLRSIVASLDQSSPAESS